MHCVCQVIALDQAFLAPFAHVGYFSWIRLLRDGHPGNIKDELEGKLWPALQINYCVWPLATFLNVTTVPLRFRVLFVNCIGLAYGCFLSRAANDVAVVASRP